MAVGARISSENLSGKTATVTFTPYTGQTSGTTVNLGTKTIPFNNITSHPYGDYNIYLAEYDYTYTLNVPEPVTDSQLYVYVSKMVNDNNYGAATLNFNDFTATVIDLNVDTNVWSINDLYPLTNSGFGYRFNDNDCGQLIIFTDASNIEVGRYSGDTCNWDFNDLDGRWIYFEDQANGIIKYFDGTTIYTYEYDQNRYYVDFQWDWDATMSNGSFVLIKYDAAQGTDHHAVLFKADGTQTTLKSWTSGDYVDYNFQLQFNDDFFVVENYDTDNNQYRGIEICGLDGTVLETIVLSGATYISRSYGFYGTNKYYTVFYNGNDNNVDYKIIQYNFNNTTLIETSHTKINYENFDSRSDTFFWPNNHKSENLMLSFSNINYGLWNNWGYQVTYCDIMYIFGNQTSFTTFVVADDSFKYIVPWLDQIGTNTFRGRIDTNDGIASVLTIMSGSTRIESLNVPVSGIYNDNYWNINDKTVYGIYTDNNYTQLTLTLINPTGGTQDTKTIEFYSAWGENESRNNYKTFYFGCNSVTLDGYGGWYINDTTTGFTQTNYYHWQNDCDNFYTPTFEVNSDMVLYDYANNKARVLTATSISNEINLPAWADTKGIEVGDSMFMYFYNDDANGYYHVKLYDFEGTLLNTLNTTFTSYNEMIAVKDRFVARFFDGTNYVNYMISANSIESVSLEDYNTYSTANDYIWWD